jgi:hypothetical protein
MEITQKVAEGKTAGKKRYKKRRLILMRLKGGQPERRGLREGD